MLNRRKFLHFSFLTLPFAACRSNSGQKSENTSPVNLQKPLVVSTWDSGIRANSAAWEILKQNGRALDAVEQAARSAEDEISCCVGLGANPDRDGKVTLDACIMDENLNCGGVAFLEHIKNPISVARLVMEKTPHVFLVGEGAEQFALENGFERQPEKLSPKAAEAFQNWLKESSYKPVINIENLKEQNSNITASPQILPDGSLNHDTMGTIALDLNGRLAGACTTSGMGFKMRGRVGDSPIIGAGLYVDGEVGAATSSGVGEEVIRICGTHLIVELMRQGLTPENACREAVRRIAQKNPQKSKDLQVGFIAINLRGEVGAFAIQKGFTFAVTDPANEAGKVFESGSL